MLSIRKPYPSDVRDDEWAFIMPYLTLLAEDVSQRKYPLRDVFNGLRSSVKTGVHWHMMPHHVPPWPVVYQQMRRWQAAGCFEAIGHDLRVLLRRAAERNAQHSAAILDSRTIQPTPESGARGEYDGHKRRKGSKVHAAVDTRGHLLALVVTHANEHDLAQVSELAAALQAATGEAVELAYVQGDTSDAAALDAGAPGIEAAVVQLPECWIVEHDFAWASRFRRLARDYERLAITLAGLRFLALACLMLHQFTELTLSL